MLSGQSFHPAIVSHGKPRYDAQQYADAVEAALKEVNSDDKRACKTKDRAKSSMALR